MSTIIKFDLKELQKLSNDSNSCVVEKSVTQNLSLQPWCLGNLKESIKGLLDYKIGKYDKEFDGILLSYKNLRILQNVATIRNDNSDIIFQIQTDYFIFKPHVGATLTGIVNNKSITHLGLLVHRVFNVVIPRPTEEPGDKWIGQSIKVGQHVSFRIAALDLFGALPYIRGELDKSCLTIGGPDADDDLGFDNSSQLLNVSYVDFDKTKPHVQKQNGDEPHETAVKYNADKHNKDHRNKSDVTAHKLASDTKQIPYTAKKVVSSLNVIENTKKRSSKITEQDIKVLETNPKSKKQKKNS